MNLLQQNFSPLTKAQITGTAAILKGQVEGINSQGGALVVDTVTDAIFANRNLAGVFGRNARVVPMASDVQSVPRRLTDMTLNFTAESSALTESSETFDNVTLTAKKACGIVRRSAEVDSDSIEDEAADFIRQAGYAVGLLEDKSAFVGDGTSTYGGMRGLTVLALDGSHNASKVTATSGHSAFTSIDTTDLGNLIGTLPSWAMLGARWYASPFAIGALFSRLGAVAGSTVGPDGRVSMSYLGWPIQATDQLPGNTSLTGKVALAFGDLSLSSMLGRRRELRIRRLVERYADFDQIGYQVTARFDVIHNDLGDNSNAGGCVFLVGN